MLASCKGVADRVVVATTKRRSLTELLFTNSFTRELVPDARTPGDPFQRPAVRNQAAHMPRQVPAAHFSYVEPDLQPRPVLIAVSKPCADMIGLDIDGVVGEVESGVSLAGSSSPVATSPDGPSTATSPKNGHKEADLERKRFTMFAAGNEVPKGTNPWALCYGGHQFGSWAGQLGDGRAITLGEITTPKDEKYELQLKGAGLTPYSRFADGFAVLRSSVREFLCSEAMHHLGIPTTRALSLVGSARKIQRETEETGAVVLRVAPTWVRFGSFEIFLARGDIDRMRSLADWVIKHHFPEILSSDSPHKYSDWLQEIVRRTAVMIAGWQSVGFCHGVMNTDNMSILGLTLDYGPFQFLDAYESGYVCNHSDTSGRYSFEAQPGVGLWNLGKLASAVSPLIVGEHGGNKEAAEQGLRKILTDYGTTYQREYRTRMANKLGLSHIVDEDFELLVRPLLAVLEKEEADYTWFFRTLSTEFRLASSSAPESSLACEKPSNGSSTSNTSSAILPDPSSTFELSTGPLAGPTATPPPLANHYPLAGPLHTWYQTYRARLLQDLSPIPSPAEVAAADETRQARMLSINPRYILRNHLAQRAIAEAESGSYAGVRGLLKVLQRPFDDGTEEEQRTWGSWDVPSWAKGMKCSCSS